MNQNTIKLILGMMIFLGLLSSLTSCSTSGKRQPHSNDATKNKSVVLRATNLLTNTIESLLLLDSSVNVYKKSDTVWALNGIISRISPNHFNNIHDVNNTVRIGNCVKYRIEEN